MTQPPPRQQPVDLVLDEIILASQSQARQSLMRQYGLSFRTMPTHIDESPWNHPDPARRALDRAVAKARYAMTQEAAGGRSALIIAADQTMALGEEIFDKAQSRTEARQRLERLQGQTHHLYSAMVLAFNQGEHHGILTTHTDTSRLVMQPLDAAAIEDYLDCGEWQGSVGCLRIEGRGREFMTEIHGDIATIQGLNMTWLLQWLHQWHPQPSHHQPKPLSLPLRIPYAGGSQAHLRT